MDLWEKVVKSKTIPAEGPEKLRHNAARLTGSSVVQEYDVMLEAGLEYSYLTYGLALVLLRVDYDEPGTLYTTAPLTAILDIVFVPHELPLAIS
ncbi:uncharacterized protein ANIA_11267 [Aspergillus nidulans FGSC A4]|uniref:Uncharacterized protein n=1 Tax=Emericella nidulans (strain FGSC A4 / ATCC 38163 / CBS 112.46 / NRRL 194 / M139) TaxID=227321 RepID=C8VU20_EMENI|nr:hypothetical protein [Aspergillus nidulans FGSC A4]CBF89726.1 TPA: hypothetical protein ANIA_11267 [Aspergillus nidulans FGSC A4]